MNTLRADKKLAVISALVEGNSIRATERMVGVHRDTIMRLLVRVGDHCEALTAEHMRDVPTRYIQADEVWTFVGRKQRRLPGPELERGDQYVFIALDAETKLVPAFILGKRELSTARRLMELLASRVKTDSIQITTDAYRPYRDAIDFAFGPGTNYATETKTYAAVDEGRGRYAPPRVSGMVKTDIYGSPVREHVSTSYVERNNWTMRTAMRRMTRLSNGFSRKLSHLQAALNLHFAWYNFCRSHRTLGRITPAMAAGVSSRVWTLSELVA